MYVCTYKIFSLSTDELIYAYNTLSVCMYVCMAQAEWQQYRRGGGGGGPERAQRVGSAGVRQAGSGVGQGLHVPAGIQGL